MCLPLLVRAQQAVRQTFAKSSCNLLLSDLHCAIVKIQCGIYMYTYIWQCPINTWMYVIS